MIALARRKGGEDQVAVGHWWHGLPGLDYAHPEPPELRDMTDRMLVVEAVMTFYLPDIRHAQHYGGFGGPGNDAAVRFIDWLTPAGGERADPIDGYWRRRALVVALGRYAAGTKPAEIVNAAIFIYRHYRDAGMTPEINRNPHRARIKEEKISAPA